MATRRQGRSADRGTRRANQPTHSLGHAAKAATMQGAAASDRTVEEATRGQAEPAAVETVHIEASDIEASATVSLMDSTSPQALLSGQAPSDGGGESAAPAQPLPEPTPEFPEPTPDAAAVADEVAAFADTGAPADEPAEPPISDAASADGAAQSASLLPAEIENAIVTAQDLGPKPSFVSVTALAEITAANDTLAAFLRNEGIATVAHWRALSTAKTPADAIRLQVGELQRAADASLSCIASLARRAGRIAATVRRA